MKLSKKIFSLLPTLLIVCTLLLGCQSRSLVFQPAGGTWQDNVYTNRQVGITFVKPEGFRLAAFPKAATSPASYRDFLLINDDGLTAIELIYYNISTGTYRNYTTEDYRNSLLTAMRLLYPYDQSPFYSLRDEEKEAIIAQADYSVLHRYVSDYIYTNYQWYQDLYIRRLPEALVVFSLTYDEESREVISDFLASIAKFE